MFNRKGQNVAEYSILIALVVAAAIAMQTYVKRGLQGRVADAVDHAPGGVVGGTDLTFSTRQYEPDYTTSTANISKSDTATKAVGVRGGITTTAGAIEETIKESGAVETTSGAVAR